MKFILRAILVFLVILVVGGIVLDAFPSTQPLFEELKMHVINLYNMSLARYGTEVTILLIIAIVIMIGTSAHSRRS